MEKLFKIDDVHNGILENDAVLVYVSAPNCNVCDAIKMKLIPLVEEKFPKIKVFEVNSGEVPEVASQFNVMTAPTVLVFFDKKEFIREGRNLSLAVFLQKVEKFYRLLFG